MATPIGTFTQNTDRQPTSLTSTPPMTGPHAAATPKIPLQIPSACARSRGSVNTFRTIDSETGVSIDPPTPCSMRSAISDPVSGARLHSSDPRLKPNSPTRNSRLRPNRSAIDPLSSSRLATTSRYASEIHCRPARLECRSAWMVGSATFRIVESRYVMNRLELQMSSTTSRSRRPAAPSGMMISRGPVPADLSAPTLMRRGRRRPGAPECDHRPW